jgi:hypothetical protein
MVTFDEYYAAKRRRDEAEANRQAIARRIHELAERVGSPSGVRPNEPMTVRGPVPDYPILDEGDWLPWSQIDNSVREWAAADSAFRSVASNLTAEQRRDLSR